MLHLMPEHEVRARIQEDGRVKVTVVKHGLVETFRGLEPNTTDLQSFYAESLDKVPAAVNDWLKHRKTAI